MYKANLIILHNTIYKTGRFEFKNPLLGKVCIKMLKII